MRRINLTEPFEISDSDVFLLTVADEAETVKKINKTVYHFLGWEKGGACPTVCYVKESKCS